MPRRPVLRIPSLNLVASKKIMSVFWLLGAIEKYFLTASLICHRPEISISLCYIFNNMTSPHALLLVDLKRQIIKKKYRNQAFLLLIHEKWISFPCKTSEQYSGQWILKRSFLPVWGWLETSGCTNEKLISGEHHSSELCLHISEKGTRKPGKKQKFVLV